MGLNSLSKLKEQWKRFLDRYNQVVTFRDGTFIYFQDGNGIRRLNLFGEGEPIGRYVFRRELSELEKLKEQLIPLVLSGRVSAFKYKPTPNEQGSEFFGQLPAMIVYANNKKEKTRVQEVLEKQLGITDAEWKDGNPCTAQNSVISRERYYA